MWLNYQEVFHTDNCLQFIYTVPSTINRAVVRDVQKQNDGIIVLLKEKCNLSMFIHYEKNSHFSHLYIFKICAQLIAQAWLLKCSYDLRRKLVLKLYAAVLFLFSNFSCEADWLTLHCRIFRYSKVFLVWLSCCKFLCSVATKQVSTVIHSLPCLAVGMRYLCWYAEQSFAQAVPYGYISQTWSNLSKLVSLMFFCFVLSILQHLWLLFIQSMTRRVPKR